MLGPLLEIEMSKKCTPLWREAHFEVNMLKAPRVGTTFGNWDVEKVHAVVARSTFRSQKCKKTDGLGALWDVQMSFRVAGARDCAPCQKWAKREGFVACPKTMAGVGHLKRICKDAFRVAGAVQKTCSSEMLGGQGADFLRGVAFWSIRSVGLLRWFCVTGAIFEGRLAELLRFWCGQLQKMRKSRRIASFLTSKNDLWGNLAELLRFWCCQVQKLRKSRRIASFSSLQIQLQVPLHYTTTTTTSTHILRYITQH